MNNSVSVSKIITWLMMAIVWWLKMLENNFMTSALFSRRRLDCMLILQMYDYSGYIHI